jgi:serine/threonine-protein kinase
MSEFIEQVRRAMPERYTVEREWGAGGGAIVYLAEDVKHGRKIAVKVLRPELSAAIGSERFQREIEVAARLQHPNIVPVYDSGEAEGLMCFTMPFIEGQTLLELLEEKKRMSLDEVVDIARDVTSALDYAHAQGIVHRDIKPGNILLSGGRALVADFGIAWAGEAKSARLTGSGRMVGTPFYVSPEQATGDEPIDPRSDIYSFSCLLYELLAGEPPYTGPSVRSIVMQHLTAEIPDVSRLRSDIPPYVSAALAKAMAKDAADRFTTASAFARAITSPGLTSVVTIETVSVPPAADRSVAVLPFANMSADPENEYFSDGMTEEIINALAQVPDLQVAARTSSFAFKGTNTDIKDIGRTLNVATVLEGSVRRAGTMLRITAQLVKVADGYHLWSDRFDREMGDVFAIQDEIAHAIADTLKVKLVEPLDERRTRSTTNLEAYTLYLKGRYCWNQRTARQLEAAISYFEQAIALDDSYALAYAGIADAYNLLGFYRHLSSPEALKKVCGAAGKAIAIDPSLAEAHNSLAYAKFIFAWDWAAAERHFKTALELNPYYPTALHWYAELLLALGRFDEAGDHMGHGHALDPMSLSIGTGVGWVSYFKGDNQAAIDQYLEVLKIDPGFVILPWFLGPAYVENGMFTPAIAFYNERLKHSHGHAGLLSHLAYAQAVATHVEPARDILRQLETRAATEHIPADYFALMHLGLGNVDRALDYFERAFDERCWNLVFLNVDPVYARLRTEPRFSRLIDRMGFPGSPG